MPRAPMNHQEVAGLIAGIKNLTPQSTNAITTAQAAAPVQLAHEVTRQGILINILLQYIRSNNEEVGNALAKAAFNAGFNLSSDLSA